MGFFTTVLLAEKFSRGLGGPDDYVDVPHVLFSTVGATYLRLASILHAHLIREDSRNLPVKSDKRWVIINMAKLKVDTIKCPNFSFISYVSHFVAYGDAGTAVVGNGETPAVRCR